MPAGLPFPQFLIVLFRNFLTIAVAVAVLVGCSKETAPAGNAENADFSPIPISFTSYTEVKSNGDVTKNNLDEIFVVAFFKGTGTSPSYFRLFEESITKDSESGEFIAANYWPSYGTIRFYVSNKALTTDSDNLYNESVSIQTPGVEDDIVVATTGEISCPPAAGSETVALTFSHIFAKFEVTLAVASEGIEAILDSIQLVANPPSSYELSSEEGEKWLYTEESTITCCKPEKNAAVIMKDSGVADILLNKKYVAPQDNATAKIYYRLTGTDGTPLYKDCSETPAQITGLAFEQGKITRLNLTFDADRIAFSASVDGFQDDGGTNVNVE